MHNFLSSGFLTEAHVHSCSVASVCVQLFSTPWTVARQAPLSMGFSRQEYWVGCHALLQGIFLTQESNLCLLHCRRILYPLRHLESPWQKISCILLEVFGKGRLKPSVCIQNLTTLQKIVKCTHPCAHIPTINTASQTRVKVRNSIRSTDWLIFMCFTTTINIAASCKIPMRHGQRGSKREADHEPLMFAKTKFTGQFLMLSKVSVLENLFPWNQSHGTMK